MDPVFHTTMSPSSTRLQFNRHEFSTPRMDPASGLAHALLQMRLGSLTGQAPDLLLPSNQPGQGLRVVRPGEPLWQQLNTVVNGPGGQGILARLGNRLGFPAMYQQMQPLMPLLLKAAKYTQGDQPLVDPSRLLNGFSGPRGWVA